MKILKVIGWGIALAVGMVGSWALGGFVGGRLGEAVTDLIVEE